MEDPESGPPAQAELTAPCASLKDATPTLLSAEAATSYAPRGAARACAGIVRALMAAPQVVTAITSGTTHWWCTSHTLHKQTCVAPCLVTQRITTTKGVRLAAVMPTAACSLVPWPTYTSQLPRSHPLPSYAVCSAACSTQPNCPPSPTPPGA